MKKIIVIKRVFSYIAAMFFAIIYALFLNADVGWFILFTLLFSPIMSLVLAWLSGKLITVFCETDEELLAKGDTCKLKISVQNKSLFPSPPIELSLAKDRGMVCETNDLTVSVMPGSVQKIDISCRAKISGSILVGIEKVCVKDYLGIFSIPLKRVKWENLQKQVAVIPDIADFNAGDEKIRRTMQASVEMEDSIDTVENVTTFFGGFLGYDNREYVPGDPLKKINWKLSAKKNQLLVRLEDEVASQSINLVLDSVYKKSEIDLYASYIQEQYADYAESEIKLKIAEDAVENALGIARVLLKHHYRVHFFAMLEKRFVKFEVTDENELETVRMELASYSFQENADLLRMPENEPDFQEKAILYVTPNRYEEAFVALEGMQDVSNVTVYSVVEEAKKRAPYRMESSFERYEKKRERDFEQTRTLETVGKEMVLPVLLSFFLSMSVFSIFGVPPLSVWSVVEFLVCIGIALFCDYVKRHKVLGPVLVVGLVFVLGSTFVRIMFQSDFGFPYMEWFLSGGKAAEGTLWHLFSLLISFTVFLSMVVFYFTNVLYRTSFLLLVSLIPFVVYVKVMQEINMVQVVIITVLNVIAFMVHSGINKREDRTLIGYGSYLASVGMYVVLFVLAGLAVPKMETKYYYLFEKAFLEGNSGIKISEEYSAMSEYSGNADGFQELNNRKLYSVFATTHGSPIYLKRQTFDLYDFQNDRWYPLEEYSEPVYTLDEWEVMKSKGNLKQLLLDLEFAKAAENKSYEEGLCEKKYLEEWDFDELREYDALDETETMYIRTINFPSVAYILPSNTRKINIRIGEDSDKRDSYVSRTGVFQKKSGFLYENQFYTAEYTDESFLQSRLIKNGLADYDKESFFDMLKQSKEVIEQQVSGIESPGIDYYMNQLREVEAYDDACKKNTELVPERIKKLAEKITKHAESDWKKAEALEQYFWNNNFVYDLSYDAEDDSVEYFLFESKTGTCSDFASAYVLMARSVGLTVRYVEGFVPKQEQEQGEFVVRTSSGHAYPEVYISGIGYMIYEPTPPADNEEKSGVLSQILAYFIPVILRVLMVLTVLALAILLFLIMKKIAAPLLGESFFMVRYKKERADKAVAMLYLRLQEKYTKSLLEHAEVCTPYEYAKQFERLFMYDISELIYILEASLYIGRELGETEKGQAKKIYEMAKRAIKAKQKIEKREQRKKPKERSVKSLQRM